VPNSAVERLDTLIAGAVPVISENLGRQLEYRIPVPEVTEGEAAGFFRSIDAGFFEVEDEALCIPRRMRPSTGFCYGLLYLPVKTGPTVALWREWLTQGALPAIAHFDLGYPAHDIALDVDAFDALVFSTANQPLIAVEAKKTTRELDTMIKEMTALVQQPFLLRRTPPSLSNSEQKARSLLALRPSFFLAVAPEKTEAFALSYPPDPTAATATLEPVPIEALRADA
jgi:hypothetical protein